MRRYKKMIRCKPHPIRVDAGPLKAHLVVLRDSGMPWSAIAAAANMDRANAQKLMDVKRVDPGVFKTLMAVEPVAGGSNGPRVPAVGTVRRLRSLRRAGWTFECLAARTGLPKSTLSHLAVEARETTYRGIERIVTGAYPSLALESAPRTVPAGRAHKARQLSLWRDWIPLWAWEDPDDPAAGWRFDPHSRVVEVVDGTRWAADCGGARRYVTDKFLLPWGEIVRLHKVAGVPVPEVYRQ